MGADPETGGTYSPTIESTTMDFYTADVYASAYVAGAVVSALNNEFTTTPDAIKAAEDIITQFEKLTIWRDENFEALSEAEIPITTPVNSDVDTGEVYQQLQEAVALITGVLVELSFTLKQERRIILDRNRTIIDLVAEFYGSIDDQLDFFIRTNELTGSEIIEVPKGREIVYYV
jgi:hypothetical protein